MSFDRTWGRLAALLSLGMFLSACGQGLGGRVCTAIAVDALTVTVVDAASGQRICDARVTAIEGAFSEDLRAFGPAQDCSYSGPTERPGRYEVRASRSGYATAVRSDVRVTADECHVIPVPLTLPLTRSAD